MKKHYKRRRWIPLSEGLFFLVLIFVFTSVYGQETVSGIVTSNKGEPLPGANVLVKGTTLGVVTDLQGNYKIIVPKGHSSITISYIGYITETIELEDRQTIDVALFPDISTLSEVVVIGYGKKEKKDVIGSVVQKSGEEIRQSPSINLANSLAGRLPGLFVSQTNAEPGRDEPQILIRGRGTFGDNNVLIVVDGVVDRDGLSRLDPQDIESISVLKDASASIYGSQAANGVILVTTKRGKEGKAVLSYSFDQKISSPIRFVENANSFDYARQINAIDARTADTSDPNYAPPFSDQQLNNFSNGTEPGTDWWKEVFDRTSTQSRHSLSLRGGTDAVKYFLSAGTARQEGIVVGDNSTDIRQYNFRSNMDIYPVDNLKISLDLAGRKENNQSYGFGTFDIIQNTAKNLPTEKATVDGKIIRTINNINPLALVQSETGYLRNNNSLLNGTIGFDYNLPFVDGLSINGWAAVDITQNFEKRFETPYPIYEEDGSGGLIKTEVARGITLSENYFRKQSVTLHAKIRYEKKFEDHAVNGFLAYEQNETSDNFTITARDNFNSSQIDQLFAGGTDNITNNGGAGEFARQNYFGRIAYSFRDKYLAQFHFRYDGSFKFPAGNRFGFFPGVSLGWRISEEPFLNNSKIISNLKLRGSWGKLGNDRVAAFQFLTRFGPNGSFPIGGNDLNVISQIGVEANPNITWETSEIANLGIEVGFIQNKITLEVDLFKENRNDILASRNASVPNYTGLSLPQENIGKTENMGVEMSIGYQTYFGDISFSIGGNFAYARNKIIFQDEVPTNEEYQKLEGHPVGSRLLYDAIGIYRTQDDLDNYPGLPGVAIGDLIHADTNGDGVLNADDRIVFEGTSTPELQYGLNLGAEYKRVELNVLFQGQGNAHIETRNLFGLGSNAPAYFVKNSWTPDTPNAPFPRIAQPDQNFNAGGSTFWQRDASFLRLKTLELAYSLPKSLASKAGAEGLRVYVSAFNLLTFDGLKKDGLADPEQRNELGWNYPHQRIINLGINVTF